MVHEVMAMDLSRAVLCGLALAAAGYAAAGAESLVYNGSFQTVGAKPGELAGWMATGRAEIQQTLTAVQDPESETVAQLTCTRFVGGTPDSHVMLAQVGHVGLKRGQWYKLDLWARSSDIGAGVVRVALSNTRDWSNTGLSGSFVPPDRWEHEEFVFRASQDLTPADSRRQIWFPSTGTLWVSDVSLTESAPVARRWSPSLSVVGVSNALPNSSFECGGTGWGSTALGIPGWGAQVFERLGEWDRTRGFHGGASWKLSLAPDKLSQVYHDYYDPVAYGVRALLLGHEGWVEVEPGQTYVFSSYVQADRADTPVRILVREADGPQHEQAFRVGADWQRVELAFKAEARYACGFVGLDLREAAKPEGTLWIDAVQFEQGPKAMAYAPRSEVEAFVETDKAGNIFTDPAAGMALRIRAFNASGAQRAAKAVLRITDFMDRPAQEVAWQADIPAGSAARAEYLRVLAGQRGFFRVSRDAEGQPPQSLRCAVIEPSPEPDSVFGMNHAFSARFALELAQAAGLRWWRDWSDKWQTVQPKPDGFDFSIPDVQINRVLDAGGNVLVLFPFPSAIWATKADAAQVAAAAGNNAYLKERLPTAYKPAKLDGFANYVKASVAHYKARIHVYEVLNEPLFTNYSLPAEFGYKTEDYVDMLRTAYRAAKEADPGCAVVGGLSCPPGMQWVEVDGRRYEAGVRQFIALDGLKWCDILNYHMYPERGRAEVCDAQLRAPAEAMRARGQEKPIWMTEFGIYAEDDPPFTPYGFGDGAMEGARRRNELAVAGDLARYAAIFCAYDVRKVFYHAGTCAGLHESNAENMFFEYGGAPRKQYAAQAELSRLIGTDVEFVRKWEKPEGLQAYEFRSRGRTVVIAWTRRADFTLDVPAGMRALDLMGNPLPAGPVKLADVPVYLVSGT